MTRPEYAAPSRSAAAVQRTRAIIGAVLWMAVLVPPVLAAILMISGTRPNRAIEGVMRVISDTILGGAVPFDLVMALQLTRPWVVAVLVLWAVAVVISIVAAIVTPTSVVRRILAPIVVAVGVVPAWLGATLTMSGLQRLVMEQLAGGAMLLGLALAVAVLGVWMGLGSTAGGLGVVPLTAFLTVIVPLAALAIVTIDPGVGSPLVSGPTRMLMSMHWVASAAVALTAVLAGFILLRTATYRRR